MKKKTLNLFMCLLAGVSLSAQTTYTVTSPEDDGAGTLRHLVENAESNDKIVIPADYTIVLNSEITIDKHLSINGQGATLKVADPGVTSHRLFTLGSGSSSTIFNITLENLELQGGNVSLNADQGTASTHGGAILILKRVNLTMKNCEISDAKAARGGALHVNDGVGVSLLIEECTFSNNNASEYGGACSVVKSQSETDGPGEAVFNNTVFEENTSGGSSAVTMNIPSTFTGCLFKDNYSSSSSRGGTTFAVPDLPSGNCRLIDCTFTGNSTAANDPTGNQDGGTFNAQSAGATFFLTNCTFYDNKGGRGAIYLFAGKMYIVNCTVTGNVAYNRNGYAGGFYATTDATDNTKEAILVNNIFAYNYSMTSDEDSQLMDTYFGSKPVVTAEKNIIGAAKLATDAPVTITSPVAFFYDEEPEYDDPLFATYTTNVHGHKIPEYDASSSTVALAEDGLATGTGLSKNMVLDPEIEALIPEKDQRGVERSIDKPCLGSYEYDGTRSIDLVSGNKSAIIAVNPAKDQLYLNDSQQVTRMDILDLAGRVILSEKNPASGVSISNIPAGNYMVRFNTVTGIVMEKLIVK